MAGNEIKYKPKFSWSKEQAKVNNELLFIVSPIDIGYSFYIIVQINKKQIMKKE